MVKNVPERELLISLFALVSGSHDICLEARSAWAKQ